MLLTIIPKKADSIESAFQKQLILRLTTDGIG